MDDSLITREQLDALAEQTAEFSLRIDMAKPSMLTHLRVFDAHDGWGGMGFISTVAWLSWRIGIRPVAAREHVPGSIRASPPATFADSLGASIR